MSFAMSKGTAIFRTGIRNDGIGQSRNSLKHGCFRQLGATRRWVEQAFKRCLGRGSMRTNRLMMESEARSSLQTAGLQIGDRSSDSCSGSTSGNLDFLVYLFLVWTLV